MPRARMDDPRVFDSKLSPFPGVESASSSQKNSMIYEAPRLLHQHSDSVVPSQQRVVGTGEIHALPLVSPEDRDRDKRASQDSVKRSWLAKAFSSPRSSGSASPRKASSSDLRALRGSTDLHPTFALPDDSYAATPGRSRPISPSVSTVPELNEDGTRMTQFTALRSANQTPVYEETVRAASKGMEALPAKSQAVLQRMDDLLALGQDDPERPDVLDDPPRKLLLATQVLQVVNVHVRYQVCRADGRLPKTASSSCLTTCS
jgi:hypothetical protein